ncbi:hypothetical protein [Streptomyces sp. NPDC047009]|uniref:hypothetical protein n=1 Tax=Streptomyces sp. NPDC047009 TaxID=3154496 RepID=UPI0033D17CF8
MSKIIGVVPGDGWSVRYGGLQDRNAFHDRVVCFVVTEDGSTYPVVTGGEGEAPGAVLWGNQESDGPVLVHESERQPEEKK